MTASMLRLSSAFLLAAAALLAGCTLRYSQALVGRIARIEGVPISNSDSGVEVGLAPSAVIAFSEPMDARELETLPCELSLAQVDYRGKWYAFYITVNFPEVEVKSYCVADQR
jgi:hypothetical protein